MLRRAVALAISILGITAGVFTLDVAKDDPGYWFAGASGLAAAALLAAGWALIASGLACFLQRTGSRCGLLLVAAGFAWFVPEWNNPGVTSALAFTAGLCLYAACAPLVGHALLGYPRGALRSHADRAAVVLGYTGAVVLGPLPALFFDPQAQGCSLCPRNLILVDDRDGFARDLTRAGVYLGLLSTLVLALLVTRRLRRVATRPVACPGALYLALVAASFAVSLDRGYVSNSPLERRIWIAEAAALVGVALGVAWRRIRSRRARAETARLVVELAQSPPPGGLRDMLAGIVGDPGLVLAYPLDGPERLVDARGRPVEASAGRERTSLVRDGSAVAVLEHAPGVLDDEQLVEEVTAAARLALENERLQAEVSARLEELRGSRARIVEAGDAERKRLERDLHDGAQQRLVGLSLSLRVLRARDATPELARAETELRLAVAELRELAHGIFPAVLADEGFAAAVEALVEDAGVPIRITGLPDGRFPSAVESAAYTVVAEGAAAAASSMVVHATASAGVLAVDLQTDRLESLDRVGLEDRVGAVYGWLTVTSAPDGRVTLHAELPCAS